MNRWCPSCRKGWPAERVVCPDCLVDLVEDPSATLRCRHCGRDWPANMASCPNCLAELRPDPVKAVEALQRVLSAGGHLYRPDDVPPFADGPACTLLRRSGRSSLVFIGSSGLVEAVVDGTQDRATPPLTCRNHDGSVLFRLVVYEPAARAVVAFGADGAALATYLGSGRGIAVRDETSAPVASLVRRADRFDLVETGGTVLAEVGSVEAEIDGWVDDQWWLQPAIGTRLPVRRLAAVGLVLAAKVLYGRPSPTRAGSPEGEPGE